MKRRGRPPYPDVLTPREWQVLALVRQDLSNREIADRLGISFNAAKFHVSEILSKLGLESRQQLVDWQPPAAPPVAVKARPWWARVLWLPPAWLVGGATAAAIAVGATILAIALLRPTVTDIPYRAEDLRIADEVQLTKSGGFIGSAIFLADVAPDRERFLFWVSRGSSLNDPKDELWLAALDTGHEGQGRLEGRIKALRSVPWPIDLLR